MTMAKSPINGLVLCGGQSRRMGRDKSWLQYHGIPQSLYAFNQLKEICKDVYVSIHAGQEMPRELSPFLIQDELRQIGPAGGIVSAHLKFPETAWLVMACDMPLVETEDLRILVNERAGDFVTFKDETLPSIWEPSALHSLLVNVSRHEYSLMRAFGNAAGIHLAPRGKKNLRNFNDPSVEMA